MKELNIQTMNIQTVNIQTNEVNIQTIHTDNEKAFPSPSAADFIQSSKERKGGRQTRGKKRKTN